MFTGPVLQLSCISIVQGFFTFSVCLRQAYHADIQKLAPLVAAAGFNTWCLCQFAHLFIPLSQLRLQPSRMRRRNRWHTINKKSENILKFPLGVPSLGTVTVEFLLTSLVTNRTSSATPVFETTSRRTKLTHRGR